MRGVIGPETVGEGARKNATTVIIAAAVTLSNHPESPNSVNKEGRKRRRKYGGKQLEHSQVTVTCDLMVEYRIRASEGRRGMRHTSLLGVKMRLVRQEWLLVRFDRQTVFTVVDEVHSRARLT